MKSGRHPWTTALLNPFRPNRAKESKTRTPTHRGSAKLLCEILIQGRRPDFIATCPWLPYSRLQRFDSTRSTTVALPSRTPRRG